MIDWKPLMALALHFLMVFQWYSYQDKKGIQIESTDKLTI